jgi:hypothetical protein
MTGFPIKAEQCNMHYIHYMYMPHFVQSSVNGHWVASLMAILIILLGAQDLFKILLSVFLHIYPL